MERKGPRAKTKTILKSVSKLEQFDSMPNLKFQTLLNKNHLDTPPHIPVKDIVEEQARFNPGQTHLCRHKFRCHKSDLICKLAYE